MQGSLHRSASRPCDLNVSSLTMETLQVIAPLIGVVLGSAISGVGGQLRTRAERKKLIARALSDLLEIRHHVVGIALVLREVRSRTVVSEEEVQSFRIHMNSIAPLDADVHKRYDEAISLLSGVDPVLAFTMRSKNKVPQFLESVRSVSMSLGATPAQTSALESILQLAITPALDEAVLKLATLHSSGTKRQVKKMVATTSDVLPEITKLLDSVANMSLKEPPNHENTTAR